MTTPDLVRRLREHACTLVVGSKSRTLLFEAIDTLARLIPAERCPVCGDDIDRCLTRPGWDQPLSAAQAAKERT